MKTNHTSGPGEREKQTEEKRRFLAERLLEGRTILLSGPIVKDLGEDILAKLLCLNQEDPKAPIDMFINSPGGDIDAGYAIFDMIRFVSAPVTCIGAGLVASAAVVILLAGDKKRRLALPNARFLLHQPSTGVSGSTADIEIEATEILKTRNRINALISHETGQSIKDVETHTRRNFWMDADGAKNYGLVSRIITSKKDIKK